MVGQILSHITTGRLDGEKLAKQAQGQVGPKDVAAATAALHFMLTNAGAARLLACRARRGAPRAETRARGAQQPSTRWTRSSSRRSWSSWGCPRARGRALLRPLAAR